MLQSPFHSETQIIHSCLMQSILKNCAHIACRSEAQDSLKLAQFNGAGRRHLILNVYSPALPQAGSPPLLAIPFEDPLP